MKTNVIPDSVDIGVDVRTLPGEDHDDVTAHLGPRSAISPTRSTSR